MTSIRYGDHVYTARAGERVLDTLLRGGAEVSYSCRKGSCHSCLLRARCGDPGAAASAPLDPALASDGHFLACLCEPSEDLVVEPPDRSRTWLEAMLVERECLAPDVFRLCLELERDLDWEPGQTVRVARPDGLTRPYSIASVKPEDYFIEVHVRRLADGAMSRWLCDEMALEDTLALQGPTGACRYTQEYAGRPLYLIATGTGIGALQAFAREALRRAHNAPIHLYHGVRSAPDLYLDDELRELAGRHENLFYHACLSREHPRDAHHSPGRVTEVALGPGMAIDADAVVALCGHPDMVQEARCRAIASGVRRERILADPFELAVPLMPEDEAKMASIAPDPELWAALGHGSGLRAILEDFYDRVFEDSRLRPFFHNVTKDRAIDKQYAFLAELIGGASPCFVMPPFNAHHWMVISDELFDHREALLESCARRHGLPKHLLWRWLALHERFRPEIVKARPRGMVRDGVEQALGGFSVEYCDVATLCDGCSGEIAAGTWVRLNERTGQVFCDACVGVPAGTLAG